TQPGTVLRVKGKGIPRRGGLGRGDQRVEVTIEVPTQLTARQRQLLEALAEELGQDVQPQQKPFMEKLRELFEGSARESPLSGSRRAHHVVDLWLGNVLRAVLLGLIELRLARLVSGHENRGRLLHGV